MDRLEKEMIDMVNRHADCRALERKLRAIAKRRKTGKRGKR